DGFGQDHRLLGRRLAADGITPGLCILRPRRRGRLAGEVATLGPVVSDTVGALAQGNHGEQSPQPVPTLGGQRSLAIAEKEALVSRLNNILGLNLVLQAGVELAARQADQAPREALKDCARHVTLGGLVRNGVVGGHRQSSSVSRARGKTPGGVWNLISESGKPALEISGRFSGRSGLFYCTSLATAW